MKIRKITAIAVAALMIVSAATGCKGNGSAQGSSEKVSITIAGWPKATDSNYTLQQSRLENFKLKYPNITVKTDEWGYDVNSFLPKAASGQLPTVYGTWFTEINKIMDANYAKDITALSKEYGYTDGINSTVLKMVTKNNKIYGLPTSAYSIGLLCNVKLFKQAGLVDANGVPKFPKTWDELATTAQTIKQKTGKAGFALPTTSNCGGWMFMNIAWSYGTVFETKTDSKWKATFNSDAGVSALSYLMDLKYKYGVLPDNALLARADVQNLLGTDQLAMCLEANDAYNGIIKNTGVSKDNLAMAQVPAGPKGQTPLMGGGIYMFAPNATNAQVDAAMKWLQLNGITAKISDDTKSTLEANAKLNVSKGFVVGPHGFKLWTDKDRVSEENAISDKYKNVDMNLWSDYDNNCNNGIKAEEPVNCQELYKAFDTLIQNVLTNKNADVKSLLTTAANNFQNDYLNSAK